MNTDLYGRGYSEAPECPYNLDLYVGQLQQLVDHVGWEKFNLLGFSMGGAISVAFTAAHPERIIRLGLIAPAGLLEGLPFIAQYSSYFFFLATNTKRKTKTKNATVL